MANLREWLSEISEPIEAVVIAPRAWEDEETVSSAKLGVVLSWDEAALSLDREFSDGFGGPEANAIWVWTPTRVYFLSCYDGAENLEYVPRHPTAGNPSHIGGW